ncbi:hypothetical protein [Limnohabitans sp. Rim28]|uniref:hypothetical protein n=1 Tax=Limnohabitans sp. Rim28 TaxID=1100720 RepID=UPI0002D6CBB1|nr:hypothetical protein [Limnohabitans sp. Rim28]PVE06667.1 hypothetical protein B472_10210 [Limnohabitans sp. Rim28]
MTPHRIDGKKNTGSEVILGTDTDEWIYPLGGSDTVDGRGGYDTLVVEWASSNFEINAYPGIVYMDTISGASSADKVTLLNVEAVQFPDKTVLLYQNQNFTDGLGSEQLVGNWGLDTVTYKGARQDYTVTLSTAGADVRDNKGSNGTDRLVQIERIHFSDMSLALDMKGHAGEVLQILGAVFGAGAIRDKVYVGIGLHYLDQLNFTATELMALALNVRLGDQVTNPAEVVRTLYQNVVGVLPTATVQQEFVALIESGQHTPVSLAMLAAQTSLNLTQIGLMGTPAVPLEYVSPAA